MFSSHMFYPKPYKLFVPKEHSCFGEIYCEVLNFALREQNKKSKSILQTIELVSKLLFSFNILCENRTKL